MLGKLIKYDFKFGKTPFLAMVGGLLLTGVIGRMQGARLNDSFPAVILLIMVAIIIGCVVLIFQNYNRSLFGDEGYLTLTLPVKRYKLILSKLIVSIIWFCIMILTIYLMMYIMFGNDYMKNLSNLDTYDIICTVSGMIQTFLFMLNVILMLYAATTAAHISIRGRRLGWPVALGGLTLAVILEVQFEKLINTWVFGWRFFWVIREMGSHTASIVYDTYVVFSKGVSGSFYQINQSMMLAMIVTSVLVYILTWRLLKKRVDLT